MTSALLMIIFLRLFGFVDASRVTEGRIFFSTWGFCFLLLVSESLMVGDQSLNAMRLTAAETLLAGTSCRL